MVRTAPIDRHRAGPRGRAGGPAWLLAAGLSLVPVAGLSAAGAFDRLGAWTGVDPDVATLLALPVAFAILLALVGHPAAGGLFAGGSEDGGWGTSDGADCGGWGGDGGDGGGCGGGD